MRRIAAITAVLVGASALAIFGTGAGDSSNGYEVRAIFDNADFVIPGEDVKIAGVKVGSVSDLDITPQKKAAIVLSITQGGFQDFRTDAHCTIRPQSLIGEKFVECSPTAARAPGARPAPKLPEIKKGAGKGQHLLPVQNTSSPVDPDEINDILRQPNANRLAIIINEFGTGLAGNGKNLSEAIHRANPALEATDKVLNILANQNKVLADLARDSDTVLAPLAAQRQHVADFVTKANTVNEATAERSAALKANLQLFPRFLNELRPTLQSVDSLSNEMIPVLNDLHRQAPAINRMIIQLGPFSEAGRPAIRSLGQAAEAGIPATKAFNPIVNQLDQFTRAAKPVAQNLSAILKSLRDTGGIERLMDYAFFQVAAVNGFDSIGHYLRAGLIVNLCSSYAVAPVTGCSANFPKGQASSAGSASAASAKPGQVAKDEAFKAAGDDPVLQRTAKVLAGEKPEQVYADEARAKIEEQQAREEKARKAEAARKLKRAKAQAAKAKSAERRALIRARELCQRTDTDRTKARCARARAHARALARKRRKLDKATILQDSPIQLPSVQLPGGIGATDPPPPVQGAPQTDATSVNNAQPPAPADTSTNGQAASAGQAADSSGQAQPDPKQGLFDYLLGN
jgi:phospholipid/cholesterol/gamma-HCH transport system substrate-binding protein